jgi:phosphatidate cytidylyltransferase
VTAGLILAAAFIAALMWRPAAVMLFVVAVVGLASVEFFNKVTEKGYRPASFAGIATCIAAPLAAYWIGDGSLPLVFAFAFAAAAVGFIGAPGVQSGPLPNVAITMLASVWIGLLGSFAALIVRYSTVSYGVPGFNVGTDTLFIVAVGVVANDVMALFVGSTAGRTPLREWISPSKSVEGLIGGTVGTFLAVAIVGTQSGTWDRTSEWILLALVISVLAPLGDLVESMFKRNLDVKDFGTFIPGHGGVLDRFDGFLFVLPGAYYLMLVIQPWVK